MLICHSNVPLSTYLFIHLHQILAFGKTVLFEKTAIKVLRKLDFPLQSSRIIKAPSFLDSRPR